MNGMYIVTMPDGKEWGVPLDVIADSRAKEYAREFDGDHERSLREDTIPLFERDEYEIRDWATNNMNWEDVQSYAVLVVDHQEAAPDYQEGWINGEYRIERRA